MPSRGLKYASKLFYKKQYSAVIKYLEPKIYQYRNNFNFYYLLANSCLYKKDYGGAYSYFKRAEQLKDGDIDCQLGLSLVNLRKNNLDETLKIWLNITTIEPGNKQANLGLNLIKKGKSPEDIFEDEKLLRRLLPIKNKVNILSYALIFLIPIITIISFFILSSIPEPSIRKEIEDIIFPSSITYQMDNSNHLFSYNMDEVYEKFDKIRTYFNDYRENMAMLEINRILLSNAPIEIKDKARMISSYIKEPDFSNIKDAFSFNEVSAEPYLYDGCYILWKGKVDNLEITEQYIFFNLLAGYHDNKELLGIIPVYFDFEVNIKNSNNIELLAEVSFKDNNLVLNGISYHKIIP